MKPFYERGSVRIYHGRAEVIGPALAAEGLAGIVGSDPPYSAKVHSKSRAGARKTPPLDGNGHLSRCAIDREKDIPFHYLTASARRALAQTAALLTSRWSWMFCDEESAWLWRVSLGAAGMEYVRTCRWVKQCATPQFTGDRPGSHDEAIVLTHRTGPKGKPVKKHWNGGGRGNLYTHQVVQEHRPGCGEPRENETQKPEGLMLDLVRDFSDPDETVIDLCMGFATTGIACIRLGRAFVGIEEREAQCALAAQRLDAELDGVGLRARQAGQLGLFGGQAA